MHSIELNSTSVRRARPGASSWVRFGVEPLGNPLAAFPDLLRKNRPYNLWLTEEVLQPTLDRWSRGGGEPASAELIRADLDRAAMQSRLAFQETLPIAETTGEAAVVAAMGVTGNLIRSLAIIGEFILDEARPPRIFRASRLWCGLIDYRPGDPYFPGRVTAPGKSRRLRPQRRDHTHLHEAFWCTAHEVEARCAEAIGSLRRIVRRHGLTPDDLRHLHSHSWAPRTERTDLRRTIPASCG